ncbi:MAG TPA: DUF805 domain-containing protein, partial [Gammaproteobacteria bacterium]|nr:DUF805 domain-containing protein [Gammaproteobacteria bacterium]
MLNFIARFYFSPHGRTSRKMYWLFGVVAPYLVGIVFGLAVENIDFALPRDRERAFALAVVPIFTWIGFAIGARRLHDVGFSAWWL